MASKSRVRIASVTARCKDRSRLQGFASSLLTIHGSVSICHPVIRSSLARRSWSTRHGMSVPRYYTLGAVARDLGVLKTLEERLGASGVEARSMSVMLRRRDERLVGVTLSHARTRTVES